MKKSKQIEIMKKSKELERITTKVQEGLEMWETIGGNDEEKMEHEIKQFPKMYHPTDDTITIPLLSDGKKIIIEIKSITMDN